MSDTQQEDTKYRIDRARESGEIKAKVDNLETGLGEIRKEVSELRRDIESLKVQIGQQAVKISLFVSVAVFVLNYLVNEVI